MKNTKTPSGIATGLVVLTTLGGCASENFYEGMRVREATRDPMTSQQSRSGAPSYSAYQAERRKLLEEK